MVHFHVRLAYLIGSLAALIQAVDIKGTIVPNEILKDIKSLGATKVVLDDGRRSGAVTRNGHFHIPHVEPGTYILQVLAPQYHFEPLRIDVLESSDLPEVRSYTPGTPLDPPSMFTLPYPLTLQARRKLDFFVPEASFNILGMLQNPMMLMMGVTALAVLGLPYMLKNLDPETMKDINESQQMMAKMQNNLDLSSGLSGLLSSAAQAAQGEVGSGPKPASNNKGKAKRR
ncbi:hypothetical protein M408DRAFT_184612 [Serendipita vermifera MAFF 305830]|uniref:ER membrane protein complex subunit 7 beta-sandwich domain-containing protein n=1 Tax=Serendipita vermifera MAFF 305830 TaxID=933852 RepID=A0A0C3BKU3_SERVB|nr:hypothetical protein M408DRAFT_184612 [Serendipita vermifera MAFF 305830]